MQVQVLQHVPFEGPGSIAAWLAARRADVGCTRLFAGDRLPRAGDIDALIAMGGPMSVNDEDALDWLRPEKQLVRDAVARGIPVLGICLGAQLIASALGARGLPGHRARDRLVPGWRGPGRGAGLPVPARVSRLSLARRDVRAARGRRAPGRERRLPEPGVSRSAATPSRCSSTWRRRPASAEALIEHCRNELVPGPYVQAEAELRAAPAARYAAINQLMERVLAELLA